MTSWCSPRQEASSFWNSGVCMIALSCLEITASMAAMRWLIVRVTPFGHHGARVQELLDEVLDQGLAVLLGRRLPRLDAGLEQVIEDALPVLR